MTTDFELEYRPPLHFTALLDHYRVYRVGDLERFDDHAYHRLVEVDGQTGWITVRDDPSRARLLVGTGGLAPELIPDALARVRVMFDLDADPAVIARGLAVSDDFRRLLSRHPGLRVPTGWDAFEMAIGTIMGQLVSVERARALTADLITLVGRSVTLPDRTELKLFPRPADLAESDLVGLGTTGARKHTLREFARRVATGELSLAADQDPTQFVAALRAIRGVGPWTAVYVAMKVLRDADAFPATDLILARALEIHPPADVERTRPWRAYAAVLLWREYAQTLKKKR